MGSGGDVGVNVYTSGGSEGGVAVDLRVGGIGVDVYTGVPEGVSKDWQERRTNELAIPNASSSKAQVRFILGSLLLAR